MILTSIIIIIIMQAACTQAGTRQPGKHAPNVPTKNLPGKIAWLKLSGKFPMDMRTPHLETKIMLESKPSEINNDRTEIGRTAWAASAATTAGHHLAWPAVRPGLAFSGLRPGSLSAML